MKVIRILDEERTIPDDMEYGIILNSKPGGANSSASSRSSGQSGGPSPNCGN